MKLKPLFILFFTMFLICTAVLVNSNIKAGKMKRAHTMQMDNTNASVAMFQGYVDEIYNNADLSSYQLPKEVFEKALTGYFNLKKEGKINTEKSILTVIDFDKPSVEKRLWVIDLKNNKVLYHTLVAHGRNSGENIATHFSNVAESNMSSLGFYLTENTYIGKHGLSLILEGQEKSNCNAKNRSVVVHGANYVSQDFIKNVGRLGRSLGCPALPEDLAPEIISTISDKTVLFIYYPDQKYASNSHYYNMEEAVSQYNLDLQTGMLN